MRALLIVPLIIFLAVWLTLGLGLWFAMLCRSFALVSISMTAILLNSGDPRGYVDRLRNVIAIWPVGLTSAIRSFLEPDHAGAGALEAVSAVTPLNILLKELFFSFLFYGLFYILAFRLSDTINFFSNLTFPPPNLTLPSPK